MNAAREEVKDLKKLMAQQESDAGR